MVSNKQEKSKKFSFPFNNDTKHAKYKYLIGVVCLILSIIIIISGLLDKQKTQTSEITNEFSSIETICELATVRSYYHNVAVYEVEPDKLFKYGLFRYGYKKMFIEYTGIVVLGIDATKVRISSPSQSGVVDVYVPDAIVLNVTADRNTLSYPITETGYFTTITAEDQAAAFSAAQSDMEQTAKNDQSLLTRAKTHAKLLIKQYIINVGKSLGVSYTVNWLNQ